MLAQDPEEDAAPFVVLFCPTCAAREFGYTPRVEYT
jgi:hypothetical protein